MRLILHRTLTLRLNHHIDADHSNNAPENLVLIEWSDHMYLHGIKLPRQLRNAENGRKGGQNSRKNLSQRRRNEIGRALTRARLAKAQ